MFGIRLHQRLLAALLLLSTNAVEADTNVPVPINAIGTPVTQDFDTLVSTGTGTLASNTPAGWGFVETGTNANTSYTAGTGSSNSGDTYSFGAAGNTDRAFGGVQSGSVVPSLGARFVNNTGATITSLNISYTGEQWRLGATGRNDRLDFQISTNATALASGTYNDVDQLDFIAPIGLGTVGALDGNAAANRVAISSVITGLSIPNGAEFWIRWNDFNAAGADDGLAIDDFSLTAAAAPTLPALSINDVSLAEGNSGTTNFNFTISLSTPAGPSGVTFEIATANNTATAPSDYTTAGGFTILTDLSSVSFTVQVNGDTTVEANETFFVNITNVTGASVLDGQGLGTILNDDVALTPINAIQGPGASSPIVGSIVTVRGIVTGVRSNGFYVQTPDASVDADPATSEGILVFTSSAPPSAAAVGNEVQVTGTVTEFVPSGDPLQPPLTELTSPTTTLISSGNPLPTAISLSTSFPSPTGPFDQLERLEGMRVVLPELTVVAPTQGSISEANATATSNGVFYGVLGTARPFREAGIQAPDPAPSGSIPPIPRFDSNPERIRVDSDGLVGGIALDVNVGARVNGIVGPLDYSARTYTVLPDPGSPPSVVVGPPPSAASVPTAQEVTIAGYNLLRFYDTADDPLRSEPILTSAAFTERLRRASQGIRSFLRTPDIVGVVEVENLSTLQALATRISSDALAIGDPDPLYQAFLIEGNDVGGIDVGFLVKSALVGPARPRVNVLSVSQALAGTLLVNPDTSTELLNDRPPLVLEAEIRTATSSYPVTVIVNHLRSLNGVGDPGVASNGWASVGARVRAKRQRQAEDLAAYVQSRQLANPNENIVLVGDFNAFEVNDGYAHVLATIAGTPVPDNETVVPGDGLDLVNPDLTILTQSVPAAQRYSYAFDGNAQVLDHVLVNSAVQNSTSARRVEYARINADFAETTRNLPGSVQRLSDHDPALLYLSPTAFQAADVSITKTDGVSAVAAGSNTTYTITASNAGPASVTGAIVEDVFPSACDSVSWTCAGASGGSCTTASGNGNINQAVNLPAGGSVSFSAVCAISAAATGSLSNTATITAAGVPDPAPGNNSATDTNLLVPSANLAITKTNGTTSSTPGGSTVYTIVASNAGPSNAPSATVADTFPASLSCTWTCVGAGGGTCTASGSGNINDSVNLPSGGFATYTAACAINAGATGTLSNTATVASAIDDPSPGNNSATDTDTLNPQADLSITKSDGQTSVNAGANTVYTITVSNAGPSNVPSATVADTFPAFCVSPVWSCSGAGGGICTPAGSGNINQNVNLPAGGSVSFSASCPISSSATGTLSNTATVAASVTDNNPGNNSATDNSTIVAVPVLSINNVGLTEGDSGSSVLQFEVTRSTTGTAFSVDYATANGTAVAGSDYTSTTGTLSFLADGAPNQTINVPISGDNIVEASESFTLTLSNPTGTAQIGPNGSGTGTITDNDSATVQFAPTSLSQSEATSPMAFTVTLSNPVQSGVTLTVNSTPGTATAADFTAISGGTVSFAPNSNTAQTVNVVINNDALDEDDEQYTLTLSGLTATGTVTLPAGTATATGTIQDEDATPTLTVSNPSQAEGNSGTAPMNFVVSLSAVSGRTVSFNRATQDGTALVANNDYQPLAGAPVTIPAGQTSVTIPVQIVGDSNAEGNESFTLQLTSVVNATPSTTFGTGTIQEDDRFPLAFTASTSPNPSSFQQPVTVTVVLNQPPQAPLPTGTIVVAGPLGNGCTINLPALSCTYTPTVVGPSTLNLSYAGDPGNFPANASTTHTVLRFADLSISKDDGRTVVNAGDVLTYTIVVRNDGPDTAINVQVEDLVPATLSNASWTCAGSACADASGTGSIQQTINLPSGQQLTYTLTATVASGAAQTIDNLARVSVTSAAPSYVLDPDTDDQIAIDINVNDLIFRNGWE